MSRTEVATRHYFFTHYETLLFHSPHSKFELGVAEGTELRDITYAFTNLNITNPSSHLYVTNIDGLYETSQTH